MNQLLTNKHLPLIIPAILLLVPWVGIPVYVLHLIILILIWGFIATSWSIMGRFGLVSLGHGAFMGVGVYTTTLMWNQYGLTPWIGILLGIAGSLVLAFLIGYPSFRFRVLGHYFALVTLALGEVVKLSIIAARDLTGGSLGMTPDRVQPATDVSWYALQFTDKRYFFYICLLLWLVAILVWKRIDRSMSRFALEAISEDEVAAASIGIHVTREKLRVTLISAALTAVGGFLLGYYNQYLNPNTLSGIGISLEIVFAAIVGGMYAAPGPTIGAILIIAFREVLRTYFGTDLAGLAESIYGLLLIVCIIFMPRGIWGFASAQIQKYLGQGGAPPSQAAPQEP